MIAARNGQPAGKQVETHGLYDPLDFAVLRTPLWPVEFYNAMSGSSFGDQSLSEFLDDERVLLALHAASPELVRALRSPTTNAADRARAKRKLRRYLIRMSTRPTPFGALAGAAIAKLGERTTLLVNETQVRHCRYLDVPWLLAFAHRVESNPEIFRQVNLQTNPCAFERGGRVHLREPNPLSTSATKDASLKATKMVRRALDAARTPIAYEALSRCLASSPSATAEKIQRFLADLWCQEFLFTDLRPPFTNGDPGRYLLERLKSLVGAEPYRFELEHHLARVDAPLFGKQASNPDSPDRGTPAPDEGAPRIHIDTVFSSTGELNVAVAREAARAAELLLSLTPWPTGLPYITAYRQAFEDRYGKEREVLLLEMIDPEYGIGVPPVYDGKKTPPGGERAAELRSRRETLFDLARTANADRRLEVELDEATLQRLRTWKPSLRGAPASLEINVFVSAASARDLDEGRFSIVVGPNVGAMEGGRSLGRFAEALGPLGMKAYQDAARQHESVVSGKQCVELNYLPRKFPVANILVRPATRKFEVHVGVQPGVPLSQVVPVSDLVVGVRGGRFYVKSLKLNRPILICSGHMANVEFAPAICRLLTEMMFDGVAMLRDLDWGMAFMHPFLPRVRVGRAVISVAKWRISEVMAKRQFVLENNEAFRNSLARWRTEWNVPRHVHLAEGDNRLVLDLENDMDLEDLRGELRQVTGDEPMTLEEVYPSLADAWLRGSSGSFVAEYVVPLVIHADNRTKPAQAPRPQPATLNTTAREATAASRLKPPGSDWLYIKLYTAPSLEDDLLTGPIRELACWARQSDIVQRWFFVRYADPQPHIRLRFQGVPAMLSEALLPKVLSWGQDLVKQDLCLRFAIDTYEPEIERYGGVDAIGLAEELFCLDSESVVGLLRLFGSQCPLRRVEVALFGLDFLFGTMGCSPVQKREIFKGMGAGGKESGPVYRERKRVLRVLMGLQQDSSLGKIIGEMSRAVEPNSAAIEDVGWRFRAMDPEGRLAPPLEAIYRSFAHMHCNRLGLDSATERLAYSLLTRSYEALRAVSGRPMESAGTAVDARPGRSDEREPREFGRAF